MARRISIQHRGLVLLGLIACLVLLGAAPIAAQDATPTPDDVVVPPGTDVAGLSQAEWSARWWQYLLNFPNDISPYLDETGALCNVGQSGPVFFLVGSPTTVERTCTIPLGTAVFIPASGGECSTVEPPPFFGSNEEELTACAEALAEQIDISQVEVTVNGEAVENLADYQVTTPVYSVVLPEQNLFEAPAGVADSVAVEFPVILDGLPEGEHVITFADPAVGTTYRLTVAAPQIIEADAPPAATPGT